MHHTIRPLSLKPGARLRRIVPTLSILLGTLALSTSLAQAQAPVPMHGEHAAHAPAASGTLPHAMPATPETASASQPARTLEIFLTPEGQSPNHIEVKAGEHIRFFVRNTDHQAHQIGIGSEADLKAHARMMQAGKADADPHTHHHDGTPMLSLQPGQRGSLIQHFTVAGTLYLGSLADQESGLRQGYVTRIQVLP